MNHLLVRIEHKGAGDHRDRVAGTVSLLSERYVRLSDAQYHILTPYSGATVCAILSTVLPKSASAEVARVDKVFELNQHLAWSPGALGQSCDKGLELRLLLERLSLLGRRLTAAVPRTVL